MKDGGRKGIKTEKKKVKRRWRLMKWMERTGENKARANKEMAKKKRNVRMQ